MSSRGAGALGVLILLGVVVLLIVVSKTTDICDGLYHRIRNRYSEVIRVRARVVRKKTSRLDLTLRTADDPVIDSSGDVGDCIITFEINGQLVEYGVPGHVYVAAYDGAEGLLVTKGNEVLQFEPNTPQRRSS